MPSFGIFHVYVCAVQSQLLCMISTLALFQGLSLKSSEAAVSVWSVPFEN